MSHPPLPPPLPKLATAPVAAPPPPPKVLTGQIMPRRRGPGGFRVKAVESPEELLEKWEAYKQHLDDHPDYEDRAFGGQKSGVTHTGLIRQKPYLLETFCVFLGIKRATWRSWRHTRSEEWTDAMELIDEAIAADKIEGAYTNRYNAVFAARHLGIAEKREVENVAPPEPAVPPQDMPNKIHPDDPDPFGPNPLRLSEAQILAGVAFPK